MDFIQEAKQSRMQNTLKIKAAFDRREHQVLMVKKCFEIGGEEKYIFTSKPKGNKIQRGGERDHNLWALKVKRLSSH